MITWKEKTVSVSDLKPYERNPRKISEVAYSKLVASLRENGYHQRIIATKDLRVIGGHQRIRALKEIGLEKIAILTPDVDLPDAQFQKLLVQDNLPFGEFDAEMLRQDFKFDDLKEWGMPDDFLAQVFPPEKETAKSLEWADDAHKEAMIPIYKKLLTEWRSYLEILEHAGFPYFSPNLTKAMSEAQFLNAVRIGTKLPRSFTLPWGRHRAFCNANNAGGMMDYLRAAPDRENLQRSLAFVIGHTPHFETVLCGNSLPLAGYRAANDFPIDLAKSLIERFCPSGGHVLDPCHGWGGRAVGFLLASTASEYTGVDCSPESSEAVSTMCKDLRKYVPKKTPHFVCQPFEDCALKDESFDFALTSPPYFDVEKYIGGEQSHSRYDNYPLWRDGFYTALITKTFKALKPGGVFALQVGSQRYPLIDDAKEIGGIVGFKIDGTESAGMMNAFCETEEDKAESILFLRKTGS